MCACLCGRPCDCHLAISAQDAGACKHGLRCTRFDYRRTCVPTTIYARRNLQVLQWDAWTRQMEGKFGAGNIYC